METGSDHRSAPIPTPDAGRDESREGAARPRPGGRRRRRSYRVGLERLEDRTLLRPRLLDLGGARGVVPISLGQGLVARQSHPAGSPILVPGTTGQTASVTFSLAGRDASHRIEVGLFRVVDAGGRVG